MEIGSDGSARFMRALRLAGIPEGPREAGITLVQKGREPAGRKVRVEWEG